MALLPLPEGWIEERVRDWASSGKPLSIPPLASLAYVGYSRNCFWKLCSWSTRRPKSCEGHIGASPFTARKVKGERLVRYQVNA